MKDSPGPELVSIHQLRINVRGLEGAGDPPPGESSEPCYPADPHLTDAAVKLERGYARDPLAACKQQLARRCALATVETASLVSLWRALRHRAAADPAWANDVRGELARRGQVA